MKTSRLCTLLLAAGLTVNGFAQIDPSNDTRPALQNDPARQPASTAVEDGGDYSQLVIARYVVDYRVFVLNDLEFQSNANLNGNSGESSFVWLPTVGATANVKFNSPFSIEATAALQAAMYTDVNNLDFWGITAAANLNYEVSESLVVYAGPELYNYQSLSGDGELSSGIAPTVGLRHTRQIIDARTIFFAGARYQHHFASPSAVERDVLSGYMGITRQLSSNFFAQGFYEYRYSNYTDGNREDWRNTVGASVIYRPSKRLRVSTGVTFVNNDSTLSVAEFKTVNIGLGSALTWDF